MVYLCVLVMFAAGVYILRAGQIDDDRVQLINRVMNLHECGRISEGEAVAALLEISELPRYDMLVFFWKPLGDFRMRPQ